MLRTITAFLVAAITIGCQEKKRFEVISPDHSGITFNNELPDSDSINVLDIENIYNGGGVGIGDFNNDSLPDIYFTGNRVSNKLYLNKGELKFTDVTNQSGTTGEGHWGRGVAVVDINGDGRLDIYVCASLSRNATERENILYINTGVDGDGVPVFKNMAAEYGLNDTAHSTMAAFFDYDNDGDLDMYLLNNEIVKNEFTNNFRPQLVNGEHPGTDKLFRNDFNAQLGHPVFTDVSKEAGVTIEGYGHGVNITDINNDGFKDIYVTNDFITENILYINQGNGTFKNQVKDYFKHTAENAMGQDIVDINNDGLVDIIELDMNPEDNFRKKMMMNSIGYQRYINNDYHKYQYQYVRNVLQINQGPRVLGEDSLGVPAFADVSFFSGIAETDWSWTPSVADYDNDGYRDLIVTNGFPKDVTDHDFMAFRNKASALSTKKEILAQIPEVKIANYAYRNNGDLTFANVTSDWGMSAPGFSNGAAYADLDNDGDLELVINNINDVAMLYKNNSREIDEKSSNYLKVKLAGDSTNKNGLGAWIEIYYDSSRKQVYDNTPFRGYLSTVPTMAHFGLGAAQKIDSVKVHWQGGGVQVLHEVPVNTTLLVEYRNSTAIPFAKADSITRTALFRDITKRAGLQYLHEDRDFIDFNIQNLLPHKLSEYGPALAVGDVDGNGLDDIIVGGSFFHGAQVFLQGADGRFAREDLTLAEQTQKKGEDMGLLLFDADQDGDLDLYIARGGFEAPGKAPAYKDVFYINDGKGHFMKDPMAIPENLISKSCVRAVDYDRDGDLDLFVAGRVEPGKYPTPVSSMIYRNDTKEGAVTFTDVTGEVAPMLINIGMICDALFTDFDNDGWQDLILAGEWMPLKFLRNLNGKYEDVTKVAGAEKMTGWWNSLAAGDFDNDGDMDYIAGNFGNNSFFKASTQYPVYITAKDFDNNGSFDAIPSFYLPESFEKPGRKEYPVDLRDDMIKQMVSTRAKFQTYRQYAGATLQHLLTAEQLNGALRLQANELRSFYLQNDGKGRFNFIPLPSEAQISILNGMVVEDFDGDGALDIAIGGNDFGTALAIGRYDALNGLLLRGNGDGTFKALPISESGIYLPGNTKSLVKLRDPSGNLMMAAGENKGPLKLLSSRRSITTLPLNPLETAGMITLKNGRKRKWEQAYGASFLSQSARFVATGESSEITIQDSKGKARTVVLPQ